MVVVVEVVVVGVVGSAEAHEDSRGPPVRRMVVAALGVVGTVLVVGWGSSFPIDSKGSSLLRLLIIVLVATEEDGVDVTVRRTRAQGEPHERTCFVVVRCCCLAGLGQLTSSHHRGADALELLVR